MPASIPHFHVNFLGDSSHAWISENNIRPLNLQDTGPNRSKDYVVVGPRRGETHLKGLKMARDLLLESSNKAQHSEGDGGGGAGDGDGAGDGGRLGGDGGGAGDGGGLDGDGGGAGDGGGDGDGGGLCSGDGGGRDAEGESQDIVGGSGDGPHQNLSDIYKELPDSTPTTVTLKCQHCYKPFQHKKHLERHILWRCLKAPHTQNHNPDEAMVRENRTDDQATALDRVSKVYEVDKPLSELLLSCSDDFARYKLCERLSVAIEGFWPILLDYRSKDILKPIEADICASKGHVILTSILTAGHMLYGENSITISKQAFVEKSGTFFDISSYRIPTTKIIEQSQSRLNRPVFSLTLNNYDVTISLHPSYTALLPTPPLKMIVETEGSLDDEDVSDDEMDIELADTFMDQETTYIAEDEDEPLSQPFSQCSLEDSEEFRSPVYKRMKLAEASPLDDSTVTLSAETPVVQPSITHENVPSNSSEKKHY